jgi:hypothetical protein
MANFDIITSGGGGGSFYQTIENNGSSLPQEAILNFVGANVSIADNPGNGSTDVTISTTASTPWTVVTGATALVTLHGYFSNSSSNVTFTLPATAGVGATFYVSNMNSGNIVIGQNSGQTIQFGNKVSTSGTGGNVTGTSIGDSLTIVCNVANDVFTVINSVGQFNVT